MRTFEVPGLAVAIVKDERSWSRQGLWREASLGDPAPVDARTRFGIASNTKLFTATALGMLVEEGKVEWDAPVIRYLPAFAMYDPWVTREITVRDLLVHRSGLGLGAGDLLWWPGIDYDRKEIVRRLRFIKPATSFRTRVRVRQRALSGRRRADRGGLGSDLGGVRLGAHPGPGGDDREQRAPHRRRRGDNVATPHARGRRHGAPVAAVRRATTPTRPAASTPSAEDMAKWVMRAARRGGWPTERGCSRRRRDAPALARSSRRSRSAIRRRSCRRLRQLPRLRARRRRPRLPRAQDAHPYRRPARLRVAGGDDPRSPASASPC